jgi:hypothetical protein
MKHKLSTPKCAVLAALAVAAIALGQPAAATTLKSDPIGDGTSFHLGVNTAPLALASTGNGVVNSVAGGLVAMSLVVVPTVPIPATLPLLATALGGLGFLRWRRSKSNAA